MKLLFLSRSNSRDHTAYTHRLSMLQRGLKRLGVETGFYYLGDRTITSHTMIPLYIPVLTRVFRKYDAIHAGGMPCAYVANICKPFHFRKVIYDVHGDRIREVSEESRMKNEKGKLGYFPLAKTLIQGMGATWFSDHYVPVSKPLKKLVMNRGIPENRITLIRNGVDLDIFTPGKKSARGKFIITYAGKFQSYQAIDDFIQAATMIQNSNVRFRVIGFSQEDNSRKEVIRNRLGGRVELIDEAPKDVLVAYLRESDVLVIPRRRSHVTIVALPTKFAEYIAMGKPVIVSDVDETAQFVQEYKCGLVYRNGAKGLKSAIVQMIECSGESLQEMGQNGRQLAEKVFDWNIICYQYYHLLKNKLSL